MEKIVASFECSFVFGSLTNVNMHSLVWIKSEQNDFKLVQMVVDLPILNEVKLYVGPFGLHICQLHI